MLLLDRELDLLDEPLCDLPFQLDLVGKVARLHRRELLHERRCGCDRCRHEQPSFKVGERCGPTLARARRRGSRRQAGFALVARTPLSPERAPKTAYLKRSRGRDATTDWSIRTFA